MSKFPNGRAVSDMSVFDLALVTAITRSPPHLGDEGLAACLADWFLQPVTVPEIRVAMDGLIARGWLIPSPTRTVHECIPTMECVDHATTLYGGCIRMLDRGMGLLNVRLLSNLFDRFLKGDS